jgi:hypothetical protein
MRMMGTCAITLKFQAPAESYAAWHDDDLHAIATVLKDQPTPHSKHHRRLSLRTTSDEAGTGDLRR